MSDGFKESQEASVSQMRAQIDGMKARIRELNAQINTATTVKNNLDAVIKDAFKAREAALAQAEDKTRKEEAAADSVRLDYERRVEALRGKEEEFERRQKEEYQRIRQRQDSVQDGEIALKERRARAEKESDEVRREKTVCARMFEDARKEFEKLKVMQKNLLDEQEALKVQRQELEARETSLREEKKRAGEEKSGALDLLYKAECELRRLEGLRKEIDRQTADLGSCRERLDKTAEMLKKEREENILCHKKNGMEAARLKDMEKELRNLRAVLIEKERIINYKIGGDS